MLTDGRIRIAGCLLVLLFTCGQLKVVKLKGRQSSITGEVTETKDKTGYEIRTKGGVIVVSKDDVESISDVVTPEDEYRQRLSKIDPKDPAARLELAEWAFEQDLLEEAKTHLEEALKLKPDYAQARLLLRQVEAKIEAMRSVATRPAANGEKPGEQTTQPLISKDWLVGEQDIYRIRLEEIRAVDGAGIQFRNNVIERFMDSMRGREEFGEPDARKEFLGLSRIRQVMYIIPRIDRDNVAIKDDIIITRDPKFMLDFRTSIWPMVLSSCAGTNCHGGAKPKGGLKFFNMPRNQAVDYTNFVILSGFVSRGRRLINRDHPDLSLLLQYGLPKDQARFRHEKDKAPTFRSTRDPSYRRLLAWIDDLSYPPQPNYRLKYKPPFNMKLDLSGASGLPSPDSKPATTGPAKDDVPLPG